MATGYQMGQRRSGILHIYNYLHPSKELDTISPFAQIQNLGALGSAAERWLGRLGRNNAMLLAFRYGVDNFESPRKEVEM